MNFVPFPNLEPRGAALQKVDKGQKYGACHQNIWYLIKTKGVRDGSFASRAQKGEKNPIKSPSEIHHTNYTLKPTKSSPFWPLIKTLFFFHVPRTMLKAKDENDDPK
jgi:hypothetical protein